MYRDHTIGVVVPAYNEERFVGRVIETMPPFVDRVYVVDDCSTDGTWEEILRHSSRDSRHDGISESPPVGFESTPGGERGDVDLGDDEKEGPDKISVIGDEIPSPVTDGGDDESRSAGGADDDESRSAGGADDDDESDSIQERGSGQQVQTDGGDPHVVPIRLDRNRGVGGAIKTGYRRAFEDGIDVTAVMAGDGQMDPDQLDRLLDPIVEGRAAYAKGNRLRGREHHESMSNWRLFGNILLTFLTKVASGYWAMMDPQNGYTAISLEALETLDLDTLYEQYGFANDVLVALNTHGFRIADVTMPAVYGEERSHIRYRSFVPNLSWLLLIGFGRRLGRKYVLTEFHPLALLYAIGVTTTIVSIAAVGWVSLVRSETDSLLMTILSTAVLAVLGALSVVLAMIFDLDVNDDMVVTVQ